MKSRHLQPWVSFLCLLVLAGLSAAGAKAQSAPIKSLPIYEQCPELKTGAPGDAVAKAITALKSQDAKTRAQASQQLAQACDSRAADPLIDLLKDPDISVRLSAVEALGKLGDPTSVQLMIDAVGEQNSQVRMAMISAFASFKTFLARNAVVNAIANPSGADISDESDMRVRCAAILTACQLKDVQHSRKSILFLHDFLQSKHEIIRKLAEQTMFELKNTRNATSEMAGILSQSKAPYLRQWAALWIGKIGLEGARSALEEAAATDSDPAVKQQAAESLKQLHAAKQ